VNASHILVSSEEEALEILAKINAGEISFEDAAAKHSSCPSGQRGGNLGDFGRGQMVPEFDVAVFNMEEGEITSVPVKTQFGYHLIKLISKHPAEEIPFAEIAPEIKNALLNEKQKSAYESKINQLKILYPVDMNI
jgi:peptidyl-prolyl cis-trans isomerase C